MSPENVLSGVYERKYTTGGLALNKLFYPQY
jgi:hypothetical protein